MKNYVRWVQYKAASVIRMRGIEKCGSAKEYSDRLKKYAGRGILTCNDANQYIIDRINSGEPFLAGRFGSTELLNISAEEFGDIDIGKYDKNFHFNHLCEWSGFFPNDISYRKKFSEVMKDSVAQLDIIAVWFHAFEDYFIRHYMKKDVRQTYLLDFEPWAGDIHWSSALAGKRVLVIHPFTKTIQNQYRRREEIFPGTDILPEFELLTLKAVQTLAGTPDDRFETWFDALDWMYEEAMKMDFDVAVIGCGAYGLPLAARIKNAGRQAIHLAGATQLLFGIKGKRWEDNDAFEYVRRRFNGSWVNPDAEERLKKGDNVEGGCYW